MPPPFPPLDPFRLPTLLTTTELWDDAALTALIADAVLLGTDMLAGLYVNVFTPSKRTIIADLVEPAYGSYVRQAVVMGAPARDPQAGIVSLSNALTWQETGTPASVIIQGIFYTHAVTPLLIGVDPFPTPIPLADLLDNFVTVLQYVQSNQNAGFSTIIR